MHEERLRILHEVKSAQKPIADSYPVHLSANMRQIKQRERQQQMQAMGQKRKIKELAMKRQQYGQYIHEFYLPKINSKIQIVGVQVLAKRISASQDGMNQEFDDEEYYAQQQSQASKGRGYAPNSYNSSEDYDQVYQGRKPGPSDYNSIQQDVSFSQPYMNPNIGMQKSQNSSLRNSSIKHPSLPPINVPLSDQRNQSKLLRPWEYQKNSQMSK